MEKIWTYKCEGDKCVRYHYLSMPKGEKRVPFMTCSMTCGDINIWPHPTIKSGVSSKSLTFSMVSVQLRMDTPYMQVETHFRQTFELFLKDLRRIQRLDFMEKPPEAVEKATADVDLNNPENIHEAKQRQQRRFADAGQHESHRLRGENIAAASILASAFGLRKHSDIDTFTINVAIHKFADMNLNFDTDESYQLTAGCKHNQL